jgi:hypothetical protein
LGTPFEKLRFDVGARELSELEAELPAVRSQAELGNEEMKGMRETFF